MLILVQNRYNSIMKNIKNFYNLDTDLNIENIMVDSRIKLDNSIFFCIVGLTVDGHSFINKAIDNGAKAIVYSDDSIKKQDNIVYIKVDDTTKALNDFCDYFYDHPSRNMKVYGVTGTNGKTTISYVTYGLLNKLNSKAGYIGTIGYAYNGEMFDQYFTTPNINDLHSMMKEMSDAGCKSVAVEISSQGLDLHRTDSVDVDVASYTNLTHDHLDYHKTYENYFNAKARLFENMKKDGVAVINIDDPYGSKMLERCNCRYVTIGIDNNADYKADNLKLFEDHSEFDLVYDGNKYFVYTNMVAKFNILNLLTVIASLKETGYLLEDIIPLLKDIEEVPGRCMHINEGQDFCVLVDYAHTPDGFVKILDYAKAITPSDKKIFVVFGLRGSGDTEKRPVCGKIVDEYCDEIYLTCDDNHYEDINSILDGIESGIKNHTTHRYEFRDQAIEAAINACSKGDTLCILSKGIETFYKVGDNKVPYEGDDKVASRVLKEVLNR